jgi:hypothetical protein
MMAAVREGPEPDRRLDGQAAGPAHVFAFDTLPFPPVLIHDRGGDLVKRISDHTSPATRRRESSWARTPVVRGVIRGNLAQDSVTARFLMIAKDPVPPAVPDHS